MNKIDNLCSKNYAVDNFREPWHAHLFALTISLNDKKIFSWSEWVAVFSKNLQKIGVRNEGNVGYFDAWLVSLEELLLDKGQISKENLKEVMNGWVSAYKATPHGKPVRFIKKTNLL